MRSVVRVHLSPVVRILLNRDINVPNGGVAQLGEHLPCKQGVKSSNLSISIQIRNILSVIYNVSFVKDIGTLKTEY